MSFMSWQSFCGLIMHILEMYPLLISSSCQAKCLHCPYGKEDKHNERSLKSLFHEIDITNPRPLLITGGEPFECRHLFPVILKLENNQRLYRIASGGHIPMKPFLSSLQVTKFLSGISLGTDVLISSRNPKQNFLLIWHNNLKLIKQHKISYSITITLSKKIIEGEFLRQLYREIKSASFVLINKMENEKELNFNNFFSILNEIFPNLVVKKGFGF